VQIGAESSREEQNTAEWCRVVQIKAECN